jgi:nitrogen fixation protein FixH
MPRLNFLPETYTRQRFQKRMDMVFVLLFVIIMGGIMVANHVSVNAEGRMQEKHQLVVNKYTVASETTHAYFAKQAGAKKKLREAENGIKMEEGIPRSYLVWMVADACGSEISLTQLNILTKQPVVRKGKKQTLKPGQKPPPPPPPVTTMVIQGLALNDSQILEMLNQKLRTHPMVAEATQETVRETMVDKEAYREFQIRVLLQDVDDPLAIIAESRKQPFSSSSTDSETPEAPESEEVAP